MNEAKHRSPIVDKMALLLDAVAAAHKGASLSDLVATLRMPRSTVYRILNSLSAHRLVSRVNNGTNYQLGPHFAELARSVSPDADRLAMIAASRPILLAAAEKIHESFRISVPDGDDMLTIDAVQSPGDYALLVRIGTRSPKHVGASGKMMLALDTPEEIEAYCSKELVARTQHTITDPEVLRDVLGKAREDMFAEDHLESGLGVRALAAPILGPSGKPIAAVSSIYFAEPTPERHRQIRRTVMEVATAITVALGGQPHPILAGSKY